MYFKNTIENKNYVYNSHKTGTDLKYNLERNFFLKKSLLHDDNGEKQES